MYANTFFLSRGWGKMMVSIKQGKDGESPFQSADFQKEPPLLPIHLKHSLLNLPLIMTPPQPHNQAVGSHQVHSVKAQTSGDAASAGAAAAIDVNIPPLAPLTLPRPHHVTLNHIYRWRGATAVFLLFSLACLCVKARFIHCFFFHLHEPWALSLYLTLFILYFTLDQNTLIPCSYSNNW